MTAEPLHDVTIHYVDGHIMFKMTIAEYSDFIVFMEDETRNTYMFGERNEEHYLLCRDNICFVHALPPAVPED